MRASLTAANVSARNRARTNSVGRVVVGVEGSVSVSLLGGFAAAVDGVPVSERAWRLKKARELSRS
ncbi:hypothetical protein AYO39_03210 [Actinobacteria bacterium SCGC AG-212-D09]|nr:hypothetical protein AYO39_03210 [Actinobacteria bacterium SCGC AG-212-D09]